MKKKKMVMKKTWHQFNFSDDAEIAEKGVTKFMLHAVIIIISFNKKDVAQIRILFVTSTRNTICDFWMRHNV